MPRATAPRRGGPSLGPLLVVGSGAVGRALASAWAAPPGGGAAETVLVSSRSSRRAASWARDLASRARGSVEAVDLAPGLRRCRVLVLCVHDEALASVAAEAAAAVAAGSPPGKGPRIRTALHTNGFRGPELLEPLREQGFGAGKLHPLRALPALGRPPRPASLEGTWFAVAGEPAAARVARALVARAGGEVLALGEQPDASARCHTAASLLAGGTVALFAAAEALLAPALAGGASGRSGRRALQALLESTAANLAARPPARALTGPTARGAVALVRDQLELLARLDPALARLYASLVERMAELARGDGGLAPEAAADLARLARSASRRRRGTSGPD